MRIMQIIKHYYIAENSRLSTSLTGTDRVGGKGILSVSHITNAAVGNPTAA